VAAVSVGKGCMSVGGGCMSVLNCHAIPWARAPGRLFAIGRSWSSWPGEKENTFLIFFWLEFVAVVSADGEEDSIV